MAKVYAVKVGRNTGIFHTWAECEAQVKGFSGAQYKSFSSVMGAESYLGIASETPATPAKVNLSEALKLPQMTSDRLDVFVDGSYVNGRYAWSYVVYEGKTLVHEDYGVGSNPEAASMNNVAGELAAAMRAAKWAVSNKKLITIHHDYQGISSWVDGSWKAKNSMTQAYRDFMQSYRNIVKFNKVAGHTGIEGNERADKLARQALGI
jgi:ribonuclease H-related protein